MAKQITIGGRRVIFHVVMDRHKFGLSETQASIQDMPEEYAIVEDENAYAGIIVYAKHKGAWETNPWSTRFLISILLELVVTDDEMVDFLLYSKKTAELDFVSTGENHGKSPKELLKIWKENKKKIK